MAFFPSLFHTTKKTSQSEAEKLLQYFFGLINRADLIVSLTEQHRALQTFSGGAQRRRRSARSHRPGRAPAPARKS